MRGYRLARQFLEFRFQSLEISRAFLMQIVLLVGVGFQIVQFPFVFP